MDWLTSSAEATAVVLSAALGIYMLAVFFSRPAWLQRFKGLSRFDSAMLVALGTLIISALITQNPLLFQSVLVLGGLYGLYMLFTGFRRRRAPTRKGIAGKALLLMKGPRILPDNLKKARLTRWDILARLRAANVSRLSQVKAVVLEARGAISVLHNGEEQYAIDAELFTDVDGADLLSQDDFYNVPYGE